MDTPHEPRLARVAALVADPARSRMLAVLLSGERATAGELARAASVTPATASGHLAQLLESAFVVCEARGRHRYYRLAGPEVAHALEALAVVAERDVHDRAWASPSRQRLRWGRCCYGHLAGRLGVALFDALRQAEGLRVTTQETRGGFELTGAGRRWLEALGLTPPAPAARRRYAYACLDWSERTDHLGGQLAEALYRHLTEQGWIHRTEGRAVALTARGHQQLRPHLGPDWDFTRDG